ncbi:hypothetical protein [Streptomyces sp. NPDC002845]
MPFEPSAQHDDDAFESRLAGALRHTGDAFDTDRAALASAGEARGRGLRLRRRVTVVGGAASIALVGLGGALAVPWSGGDSGRQSVGDSRPSSSLAPSTTASATAAEPAPVSGDELLSTLKQLLPEGEVSDEGARGTDEELGPFAHLVYDDGEGESAIGVSLGRMEPGSQEARETTTCPDKRLVPYDDCNTSELSDGSVLMVFQGYEYPDRRVETKHWLAELITPQGHHIGVSAWNARAQKDAPISRPEPALSPAQLQKVAEAPEWRAAIDTIPENPKGEGAEEPGFPPGVDSAAIRKTLIGLLPEGVDVVGEGGQETEYAYIVVDDGQGETFVQINVQPGMSDVEHQLFGPGSETLPDGTKVTTRQGPGDVPGVVMWTADTMRPGGMRVVISAFNSGTQNDPATRDTPALTIEQLKAMAVSEQWAGLQQGLQ